MPIVKAVLRAPLDEIIGTTNPASVLVTYRTSRLRAAGVKHGDISVLASNADEWYKDGQVGKPSTFPDRALDRKDDRAEAVPGRRGGRRPTPGRHRRQRAGKRCSRFALTSSARQFRRSDLGPGRPLSQVGLDQVRPERHGLQRGPSEKRTRALTGSGSANEICQTLAIDKSAASRAIQEREKKSFVSVVPRRPAAARPCADKKWRRVTR